LPPDLSQIGQEADTSLQQFPEILSAVKGFLTAIQEVRDAKVPDEASDTDQQEAPAEAQAPEEASVDSLFSDVEVREEHELFREEHELYIARHPDIPHGESELEKYFAANAEMDSLTLLNAIFEKYLDHSMQKEVFNQMPLKSQAEIGKMTRGELKSAVCLAILNASQRFLMDIVFVFKRNNEIKSLNEIMGYARVLKLIGMTLDLPADLKQYIQEEYMARFQEGKSSIDNAVPLYNGKIESFENDDNFDGFLEVLRMSGVDPAELDQYKEEYDRLKPIFDKYKENRKFCRDCIEVREVYTLDWFGRSKYDCCREWCITEEDFKAGGDRLYPERAAEVSFDSMLLDVEVAEGHQLYIARDPDIPEGESEMENEDRIQAVNKLRGVCFWDLSAPRELSREIGAMKIPPEIAANIFLRTACKKILKESQSSLEESISRSTKEAFVLWLYEVYGFKKILELFGMTLDLPDGFKNYIQEESKEKFQQCKSSIENKIPLEYFKMSIFKYERHLEILLGMLRISGFDDQEIGGLQQEHDRLKTIFDSYKDDREFSRACILLEPDRECSQDWFDCTKKECCMEWGITEEDFDAGGDRLYPEGRPAEAAETDTETASEAESIPEEIKNKLIEFWNNPDNLETIKDEDKLKEWAGQNGWEVNFVNDSTWRKTMTIWTPEAAEPVDEKQKREMLVMVRPGILEDFVQHDLFERMRSGDQDGLVIGEVRSGARIKLSQEVLEMITGVNKDKADLPLLIAEFNNQKGPKGWVKLVNPPKRKPLWD
jgi:hypothetical protein